MGPRTYYSGVILLEIRESLERIGTPFLSPSTTRRNAPCPDGAYAQIVLRHRAKTLTVALALAYVRTVRTRESEVVNRRLYGPPVPICRTGVVRGERRDQYPTRT